MASFVKGLFGSCGVKFNPDSDIPDLSSKVIIVTGGNAGIGKETVLQLAKHRPHHIYLAARSKAKADNAIADILSQVPTANVTFLELDLTSFSSIKRAADTVTRETDRLDILVNNAGIMAVPPGLTADGYEIQFGTNHMGHALLTKLLLPLLSSTAARPRSDVRIINVSSQAHKFPPRGGFLPDACKTDMRSYLTLIRYDHSKLANVLHAKELARRYPALKVVALHPGRVQTTLTDAWTTSGAWTALMLTTTDWFNLVDARTGALTQLWAATAEGVKSGSYYDPVGKEGGESGYARDAALAEKLWSWTEGEFERCGY